MGTPYSIKSIAERTSGQGAGAWPAFMTPEQLSHLLGVSKRKLEHDRHRGGGIPFVKLGRRILYRREDVVDHLLANCFCSTAEAKRAGK